MREHRPSDTADTMRWIRRGGILALLLIGWGFILQTNHFHISPPVVFICLAYFAGVIALYTLYRLGATAVAPNNEEDDAMSWVKPLGALDELDHEKRALLKAIKEAEFDHQMGKLSKADADSMIALYRARAIEIIKEIEVQSSTGKVGSARDQILREVRARLHIEEKASANPIAAKRKDKKGDKGDKQKARADKLADAVNAAKSKSDDDDAAVAAADAVSSDTADVDVAAKSDVDVAAKSDVDVAAKSDIPVDKSTDKSETKSTDKPDTKSDSKSEAKEAAR